MGWLSPDFTNLAAAFGLGILSGVFGGLFGSLVPGAAARMEGWLALAAFLVANLDAPLALGFGVLLFHAPGTFDFAAGYLNAWTNGSFAFLLGLVAAPVVAMAVSRALVRFREGRRASSGRRLREIRRSMQPVFQDPFTSLDPRMLVKDIVGEPILLNKLTSRAESEERGIAEAIARSIGLMSRLQTPIVTVITGEGGSGGALAIAVAEAQIAKLRRKVPKFALLVGRDLPADIATERDVLSETFDALRARGHGESDARKLLDDALGRKKKYKDVDEMLRAVYEQRQGG